MKLTPLIFIVYLVASGDRRSAIRSCVTFLVATGLAWIVLPRDSSVFWLHQAFSPGHRGGARSSFNQSWWGFVGRLPAADGALRMVAWLALCAVTLVVGVLVTRRLTARGRTLDAVLVVAIVGVLVSPVSWTHHWCFLVLVPVLLLVEQGRPKAVTWAMATVLVVAAISPYGWHLHGAGAVLASFSLVLAGAGLLAAMALAELRRPEWSQHAPGDVVDAPVSSVR